MAVIKIISSSDFPMPNIKRIYWYCSGLPVLCEEWIMPLQNLCLGMSPNYASTVSFLYSAAASFSESRELDMRNSVPQLSHMLASKKALPQGILHPTCMAHIINDPKWTGHLSSPPGGVPSSGLRSVGRRVWRCLHCCCSQCISFMDNKTTLHVC